tara:strand:+ start:251 stop:409 length:159 start_codon:yes stop_codon:yes gene_type:complete
MHRPIDAMGANKIVKPAFRASNMTAFATEPNFGKEREADGQANSFLDRTEFE